jgi:hypothetical protein
MISSGRHAPQRPQTRRARSWPSGSGPQLLIKAWTSNRRLPPTAHASRVEPDARPQISQGAYRDGARCFWCVLRHTSWIADPARPRSARASSSRPNSAMASPRGNRGLSAQAEAILDALEVLPFETPADAVYGRLRAGLERAGRPIGANDLLIRRPHAHPRPYAGHRQRARVRPDRRPPPRELAAMNANPRCTRRCARRAYPGPNDRLRRHAPLMRHCKAAIRELGPGTHT